MPSLSREPHRERLLDVPRLRSLVSPTAVPVTAGVWLMGCLLALVTSTPYRGDDLINKDIRAIAHAAGETLPGFTSAIASQWMTHEGRFFPGALAWTYSLFWFADSRVAYKLVIGLVVVGAIAVFGLLVARLTGRWKAAAVFLPIAFGLMQLRTWHDGIVTYAGLVPLTAGLSIAAVVFVISRQGIGWAALAVLSYSLALVTYETVLLFAPVLVAIIIWSRRTWRPALVIVIPAVVQLGITAFLRLSLQLPAAGGYTIDLDPRTVFVTFCNQVLAALPLSQWWLSTTMPTITAGAIVVGVLTAGVPAFLSVVYLGRAPLRATRLQIIEIAVLGAWIWLSSSVLISITVRWQDEMLRGQGYLSVIYGYFGVALFLLSGFLAVDRLVADRSTRAINTWRYGSAFLVAALVSLTFAGNVIVASVP